MEKPVESVVAVGGIFYSNLDLEALAFSSTSKKEQRLTVYNVIHNVTFILHATPYGEDLKGYKRQTFVNVNVSRTDNRDENGFFISATYYCYDVHGRVK